MRLYTLGRIVLGALFVFAAYDKVLHPAEFATALANYRLLPPVAVGLAAHAMPYVELACGVLLIAGVAVPGASLVTTGLMVVFSAAILQAVWRGLDIECGCFSAAAERVGYPAFLRDLALLTLSLALFRASLKRAARSSGKLR